MLQECLDIGMLEIGDDDDKFQYLTLASQDLKAILLDNRAKLIPYILIALDPHVSSDESVLIEVENAVKTHWRAFKNRFADTRPLPLLRAVILEALELAGQKDSNCAAVIWLTGSSFLPFAKLGREQEICKNLLDTLGQTTERIAVEKWQGVPTAGSKSSLTLPKAPAFKVEVPEVKSANVSQALLTKTFSTAVGASRDADGNAISDVNPHPITPNYAINPNWTPEFAKRVATGLSQAIGAANKSQSEAQLTAIAEMLQSFGGDVSKYLPAMASAIQKAVEQAVQSSAVVERESALLWWDRTLYSESFKCGYRSLDPYVAVVLMAYDLYIKVPAPHPQSVEYLLRDVVRDVVPFQETEELVAASHNRSKKTTKNAGQTPETSVATDKGQARTSLQTFFDALKAAPEATQLQSVLQGKAIGTGRVCLLQLIYDVLSGTDLGKQQIADRIGVEQNTAVSLESLAVWIFRDLQAQHLAK